MTAILEHADLLRELGINLGLLSLLVLAYALLAPAGQPHGRRWDWRELAQGLRLAAELRPDLLLLDMRLPDMDGL